MKRQIVVIAPIAARYDAISTAAADNFRLLHAKPDWDVTFLTSHNELDLPAKIVHGITGLLDDSAFRSADILLYHFGIYHPLIDALLVGNGHARQIVVFHNITPAEFVSAADQPVIERSYRQVHNLRNADEIWADSPVNAAVLDHYDIDPQRVAVIPLSVNRPEFGRLRDKHDSRLEFLFVGRIVAAKGVRDLIEAIILARPSIKVPIRVTIAGNVAFSDASYISGCKARIAEAQLQDCFELISTPSDEVVCALYARAHILCIPSFHEGFCVPVIEGLRAGCIPIGYAVGNVPNIANHLGRLVPPGDVACLADALVAVSHNLIVAARDALAPCLTLDCGTISVDEFDRRARAHAETFDVANVAPVKLSRVSSLLEGLPPNPNPPVNIDTEWTRKRRGRLVNMLNRLTQIPEPVKRRMRVGFVRIVNAGRRIPGLPRAAVQVRLRLPGPYQWFADHYDAYRAQSPAASLRRAWPPVESRDTPKGGNRLSMEQPQDLTPDERICFARLTFAANARRRGILW
jgi:glycosyltransferase involved in cell wall biosynthesis